MTQLGFVKMTLELLLTSILMLLIPATEGLRLRFTILWVIMQFWSGRYKHKALLFSDEMLLLVKSFGGFFSYLHVDAGLFSRVSLATVWISDTAYYCRSDRLSVYQSMGPYMALGQS